MSSGYDDTAEFLFVLGFDEKDDGVFVREYRKHDGRRERQVVVLDNEGELLEGEIPPYRAVFRKFKQR